MNHVNATNATSGSDAIASILNATADAASKAANATSETVINAANATQTYFAQFQDFAGATWNSTKSGFSGAGESVSDFFGSTTATISQHFQFAGEKLGNAAQTVVDTLSYDSLAATAGDVNAKISSTVSEGLTSFTSSSAVTWVKDTADSIADTVSSTANSASQTLSDNLPASNSWLPVAVFGVSAFAGVKSLQAAHANYNAGNLKRAVAQIFVGAASFALAGSVAYQSPIGQGTTAYAGSFFGNGTQA
jgi:hypothetical protein